MSVSSWTAPDERPDRNDNRPDQEATDNDNFHFATTSVCNNDTMADIGAHNIQMVHGLYHQPIKSLGHPMPPPTAQQHHHLLGDICASIKTGAKKCGSGANADLIDAFIDLVSLKIMEVISYIRQLFNLVDNNIVPVELQCYFRDSYLFCLYKRTQKISQNSAPIGIPSAMQ